MESIRVHFFSVGRRCDPHFICIVRNNWFLSLLLHMFTLPLFSLQELSLFILLLLPFFLHLTAFLDLNGGSKNEKIGVSFLCHGPHFYDL